MSNFKRSQPYFVKDSYTCRHPDVKLSPQLVDKDTNLVGVKLGYILREASAKEALPLGLIEGKYEFYHESIGVNANVLMVGLRFTFQTAFF